MSFFGFFSLAVAIMPSPRGPHPLITTTSSNWMLPSSVAWTAQARGSMYAACHAGMFLGTCLDKLNILGPISYIPSVIDCYVSKMLTLWTMLLLGYFMYVDMAPTELTFAIYLTVCIAWFMKISHKLLISSRLIAGVAEQVLTISS